ncbi:MAG: DUF5320 domain-containing protein [Chloroflexi bacterium]|nr:DUF5320 domain-containing protein [Chloroflexota bacterium]
MPFGDRTGPWGLGPMTGRAAGYCAGYPVPGYMNPVPGRGWWFGRGGWGRGWRHRHWYYATGLPGWVRAGYVPAWGPAPVGPYPAPMTPEQEAAFLEQQATWLREQLQALEERIAALKREAGAEKEGQGE